MQNTTVKSAYEYGFEAFGKEIQCPAFDKEFSDAHIKGLEVGQSEPALNEWHSGFDKAQDAYLREKFPEMY